MNNWVELSLALHRAHAKLRLVLDEELGAFHGIDFEDYALLHALTDVEGYGASLPELARALGATRSSILRCIRPLEKIGLVDCEGTVAQRRVALTSAGRRTVKSADSSAQSICASSLPPLSAHEVDTLQNVLPRL